MKATGAGLLRLARRHAGEPYVLGALAPKNNRQWCGPWDCAEFASWLVYQVAGRLYGCHRNAGKPASADAYTGYWARDAEKLGKKIPWEEAARTAGAMVLRVPRQGARGHIVISDGQGGTVEAHSPQRGVIAYTLSGRRWDMGVLVPGIRYRRRRAKARVAPPRTVIYRLRRPLMRDPTVKKIQQALKRAGFHPGTIDGVFGEMTQAAVVALQAARGLAPDGEVGPLTARALGVKLPAA